MRIANPIAVACVVAVTSLLAAPAAAEDHAFVGNKNRKKCHIKEWRSWSQSAMAQSFETLKPGVKEEEKKAAGLDPAKDYTTDATCLGCHTTGHGKEGGFVDAATSPELAFAGCEACHGAGGSYTQDGLMTNDNKEYKRSEVVAAGMVEKMTEEVCTSCHNSDNPTAGDDYVFDFGEMAGKTHEKYALKYNHD